jgi:uncharacterized membrane protein YbjE (DUF340 family)
MAFLESNDHPNANNSKYLGIAGIILFIVGACLPWITNHIVLYNHIAFNVSTLILAVGTYLASVKVGFANTFETNDDWKTYVQITSTFGNILVPALFVASTLN